MHVLDWCDGRVLRRSRTRNGDQGFAGRVGNQVQMEIIGAAVRHV
jgi:hypothetical protein